MTPQPPASPGAVRTVLRDGTHRHHSDSFWDVDECRWQCVDHPAVRYAPELGTVTERLPG
jgi:hypothetical protein